MARLNTTLTMKTFFSLRKTLPMGVLDLAAARASALKRAAILVALLDIGVGSIALDCYKSESCSGRATLESAS
ncbi:MAG: hypothetical protein ACREJ0_16980 [Geminicoccaceae bacterium]